MDHDEDNGIIFFCSDPDESESLRLFPMVPCSFSTPSYIVGKPVLHEELGVGKVVAADDLHVTVSCSGGTVELPYPEAFAKELQFRVPHSQRKMENYLARMAEALEKRRRRRESPGSLRYDPIEDTLCYMDAEIEVDAKIKEEDKTPRFLGYCHLYWMKKQQILKEEYHIEWRSPAEMNPHVMFD